MRSNLSDLALQRLPHGDTQYVWDASLPSFGVRVGKRRKTFVYKLKNNYYTIGHYPIVSLRDARTRAKQALYAKYLPGRSIQAADAAELYFRAIQDDRKAGTLRAYTIYLRRLPNKPLTELTPKLLYDALPKGKGAGNLCFSVFKAFLSWCVERDHLQSNPLISRKAPNKLRSRDRLLTDDEIRLLWAESRNHNSFGAIVRTLILTGQRLNQIASLEPTWLQDENTVEFPAYVMKGNIEHIIPLTQLTRAHLPPGPTAGIKQAREKLRAAVPQIPHWTPHDFRRYFSSTMAKLGTPIDVTEALLAHTTGSRNAIAHALERLPTKAAIIDGEVVALTANGMPDFGALHGRSAKPEDICAWAFDLLSLNGADLRRLPLIARRTKLEKLLERHEAGFVLYSEPFNDAEKLLIECEKRGIEGIVSKRRDAPYRSGKSDWIKVKTKVWREANKERVELFNPEKRGGARR